MTLSITEIARAKDTVSRLLERLGLEAYLFEVEPRPGQWEVRVECATETGWGSVVIEIEKQRLLASLEHGREQERLLEEWRKKLADCKSNKP